MTEAFKVPEPSKEAFAAAMHEGEFYAPVSGGQVPGAVLQALVAAYAVDIPGIVKAEVERALRQVRYTGGANARQFNAVVRDYLNERFPEAAPEMVYSKDHLWPGWRKVEPTPRGAPERCTMSGNLGRCVLAVRHKGPCQFHTDVPLATPRAPVECYHVCTSTAPLSKQPGRWEDCVHCATAAQRHRCDSDCTHPVAGSVPEPEGYQCIGCGARSVRLADFQHLDDCAIGGARVVPVGVAEPKGEAASNRTVGAVACRCGYLTTSPGRCPRCDTYVDINGPHPEMDRKVQVATPQGWVAVVPFTEAHRDFLETLARERVAASGPWPAAITARRVVDEAAKR